MRQRAAFRFVSVIVAVWLVIVLAEPAALHVCPAHDGVPSASASTDPGQHASLHVHGSLQDAGAEHGGAPTTHQCSCLGHCAGSSASAAALATAPDGAIVVASTRDRPTAELRFTPPVPAFLLPFANGPPLSLA